MGKNKEPIENGISDTPLSFLNLFIHTAAEKGQRNRTFYPGLGLLHEALWKKENGKKLLSQPYRLPKPDFPLCGAD